MRLLGHSLHYYASLINTLTTPNHLRPPPARENVVTVGSAVLFHAPGTELYSNLGRGAEAWAGYKQSVKVRGWWGGGGMMGWCAALLASHSTAPHCATTLVNHPQPHKQSHPTPPHPTPPHRTAAHQVTQDGLSVVLDLAAGAFVKSGPLVEIAADLLGRSPQELSRGLGERDLRALSRELKGVRVSGREFGGGVGSGVMKQGRCCASQEGHNCFALPPSPTPPHNDTNAGAH